MPEITFNTVPVPDQTRVRKVNPFASVVKAMSEDRQARSFEMPCKTDEQEKAIESAINQCQTAGRQAGVTVRKTVVKNGGTATVTVWVVDKITRTAKPADK